MRPRNILVAIAAASLLFVPWRGESQELKPVFPGANWERVKPEAVSTSSARLEVLRSWLKTQKTTAMMIVVGGRSIFEYGDITRVSKVASIRKSILAMLYGKYVAEGKIDLNTTVKELGLDDVKPFLPIEERATLLQILTARSGIYHESANTGLNAANPQRGSHAPGTYFQYQNWDFNAAGTAFEKLVGRDLYDVLESDLAKPLEMQDFDRRRQKKITSMPQSVHPEYAMYLSTRDMARLGFLMLRKGQWNGRQLLPAGWSERITTLVTHDDQIRPEGAGGGLGLATVAQRWGYGMLWWVWDAPATPGAITGPYSGAYMAMGSNGQFITVLPAADAVVVHKVDIDADETPDVSLGEFMTSLGIYLASYCGDGDCK
ncbi:MAG: serine hydrolase [Acidobacteriia bacterium]|nr:serine hydrolase [Terriglobia bacterium]MBV8903975.1 serine hydrolase [Terriglobia bacterium]